jgi:fructose/tagatose bisphosphate aldolase
MWIGVIDSIASADEMKKAGATELKKFTDTEYKKFEPVKWMYKTADEAIEAVKTKYVIDQIMEAKVRALYTN